MAWRATSTGLDLRLLFLPSDPYADTVPLDNETLDWLKEPRPAPYGGPAPQLGRHDRGTSSALVIYDQYPTMAAGSATLHSIVMEASSLASAA